MDGMSAKKTIPLAGLMKEHKHLVKVLKSGSKKAQKKEAGKQEKEMKGRNRGK
jgi:hypothetical protein